MVRDGMQPILPITVPVKKIKCATHHPSTLWWRSQSHSVWMDLYGIFTLHGTGTGTGNETSTIGDNGSGSCTCLSAVWTENIIYRNPLILVLFPVPVPFPVPCSVNAPLVAQIVVSPNVSPWNCNYDENKFSPCNNPHFLHNSRIKRAQMYSGFIIICCHYFCSICFPLVKHVSSRCSLPNFGNRSRIRRDPWLWKYLKDFTFNLKIPLTKKNDTGYRKESGLN